MRGDFLVKLRVLQKDLIEWSKRIHYQCNELKKELTWKIEDMLLEDAIEDNLASLIDSKVLLNLEVDKDKQFWEQRARVNWLRVGDKNPTFFHNYASQRRFESNLIIGE